MGQQIIKSVKKKKFYTNLKKVANFLLVLQKIKKNFKKKKMNIK